MANLVARLENWALVRIDFRTGKTTMIDEKNIKFDVSHGYCCALTGQVYGNKDYTDGEAIQTTSITLWDKTWAQTHGTSYMLGKRNPFYDSFEKAIEDGIPILDDINFNKHAGKVYISGRIRGGEEITNKLLVSQDLKKSVVTFDDDSKVFVDWFATNWFALRNFGRCNVNLSNVELREFCSTATYVDLTKI